MAAFVVAGMLLILVTMAAVGRGLWRHSRATAMVLALLLGGGTAAVYLAVGTPDALDPRNVAQATTLEEAIAQLERRLVREPASVEGWVLLGRSRMAQQQWAMAREAFARAHALLPDEPDLKVEYAEAQMRAAGDGGLPASAVTLLEQALAAQPDNPRALLMLGAQRLQAGEAGEAVTLWERLLPRLEPSAAQALAPQIAMAREQAGLPPAVTPAPGAAGPTLALTVELAPELAARLRPGATLYVFARSTAGGGLPVAVKRLAAGDFPVQVLLSDSDGLMPAQKLSQQAQVDLMARVSLSGDAKAASGDLEAAVQRVDVRDGLQATLRIDRVNP